MALRRIISANKVAAATAAVLMAACMITACAGGAAGAGDSSAAGENAGQVTTEAGNQAGQETAADPNELQTRELFAMDTYMSLNAYGEDAAAALDEAEAEIKRLDAMLSAESEDSEISVLNQDGGGPVTEETADLIARAKEINALTDGAFEITIYPVKKLWGFKDGENRVPGDEEIREALQLVGSEMVNVVDTSADTAGAVTDSPVSSQLTLEFVKPGMQIDLGGIAKGYTSARVTEIFKAHGVRGMVNLGGNVQACGAKPDGSDWRVAIRKPESLEEDAIPWVDETTKEGKRLGKVDFLGIVETHDQAVVTSGGYERYFEQDGEIYHHILDPATGRPSESDIVSATVVSADGTLADGLSTSLFVMGTEKAAELWRSGAAEFEMILMDRQGKLYVSEGLRDHFTSDLEVNWIGK